MPEAAGALMTGNVLLSGRDGPTFTASSSHTPTLDRTLGKDRRGRKSPKEPREENIRESLPTFKEDLWHYIKTQSSKRLPKKHKGTGDMG